jgi:competence protein ComEA
MGSWRTFFAGFAATLMIGIAVMLWMDRAAPVQVIVNAAPVNEMHVAVLGEVNQPGVVRVPQGARLAEVVELAGGFTGDADTTLLNLAGHVGDGEQILIPSIGGATNNSSPGPNSSDLVNINTATVAELDNLPGIGEVLANRIVTYRQENGPFRSVDDLSLVEGISTRMVDDVRSLVTVDGAP